MNSKEKWELLLQDKRFREKSKTISSDGRNPFENDYGRLISSAPIRRLQDKTQVFPLEQSDYIRTRLTHSLEASYLAGSIGQSIENFLLDKKEINYPLKGSLSSLLRVSGLVHDLGNPPFGHFGEEAIKEFFKEYFNKNNISLSDVEKSDFINFDGNAQTFRILTKLYYFGDEYGYNLTFSSLASIIKYPSDSINGNKGENTKEIAKKKFGYFVTEKKRYEIINEFLNLNNRRHPVVYLLEAADDIAYSAADIEDGIKLGIIGINDIKKVFEKELVENKKVVLEKLDELEKKFKNNPNSNSLIVQQFRIFTQRIMIENIINSFKNHYDAIMNGTLENEIIKISDAKDIRKAFKKLSYVIFDDKSILKKEIAGWEAIYGLLKIFVKASESENFNLKGGNSLSARLYKIISSSHRKVYEDIEKYTNIEYKRLQLIVDFISGMTDTYAITLFQKLKGIKI